METIDLYRRMARARAFRERAALPNVPRIVESVTGLMPEIRSARHA